MSRAPHPSNRRVSSRPTPIPATNERIAIEPKKPWDPSALWRNLALAARVTLAVGVVAVGVVAAIGARRYVTSSPRFALRDLRVTGANHRTAEVLAAAAGVRVGDNVVELDLESIRARIEADPWVERATVMRRLPASLSIDVVEREAAAVVAMPGGAMLATPTGALFKRVEEGDPVDLPVITGIGADEAVRDRDGVGQLVRRALDLDAEIERAGIFGGRVEELAFDPDGSVSAILGRRGVRVAFGLGPYRGKIRLAARVETELSRRGAHPTAVFLDDDQHPDRIVVRLVAGLPPAQVTIDGQDESKGHLTAKASKGGAQ
ncbi:MAG: cell division protein FtsQ/DivIB [Polyangiales bacterium]